MSLIDFKTLAVMIPEKGAITVSVQKLENGELRVTFAPKFAEKDLPKYAKGEDSVDVAKAISPIVFDDSIENLDNEFEQTVKEIMDLKGQLLNLTAAAAKTVSATSVKKKTELKKAIEKKSAAAAKTGA